MPSSPSVDPRAFRRNAAAANGLAPLFYVTLVSFQLDWDDDPHLAMQSGSIYEPMGRITQFESRRGLPVTPMRHGLRPCRAVCRRWGIEPDPNVLAYSTIYQTVRADLKGLTGCSVG
jgi:hypothetical protein